MGVAAMLGSVYPIPGLCLLEDTTLALDTFFDLLNIASIMPPKPSHAPICTC